MIHPHCPLFDLSILLFMFLMLMVPPSRLMIETFLALRLFMFLMAHVPRLTMQLISGGQIFDSGCRVILDFDSLSVQDHRTCALLGAGPGVVTSRASGSLTSFIFPLLPSPPVSPPLLACLPPIVLVTCVALVSLVRRGLLGSVFDGVSLDC
jgi:hypothetical protein